MDWQRTATVLLEALTAIGKVVSTTRDRGKREIAAAADSLMVIGAIVEAITPPEGCQIDPDKAEEELQRLMRALDDNDKAADDALAAKFDTSGDPDKVETKP